MPCPIKLLENYQKVKRLEKSALSTKTDLTKGYTMFFNENSRKNSQGVQVEIRQGFNSSVVLFIFFVFAIS